MPTTQTILVLFISGQNEVTERAKNHLKAICDSLLGNIKIEIVDIKQNPELGQKNEIMIIPTVIRQSPPPYMKVVGELSERDRVIEMLQLE